MSDATADYTLPLEGQVLRQVEYWNNYEEISEKRTPTLAGSIADANIITSEVDGSDKHKVVLDIDFPAKLVPSSTEGHFHLFIDKEVTEKQLFKLVKVLADVGVVEEGYYHASRERGYTAVRTPWTRKTFAICVGCTKAPAELPEYARLAEDEGYKDADQAVRREEGTYNRSNGHFYCTSCYIKAGQPNGVAP